MSSYWVFHEDKVNEAIQKWLAERWLGAPPVDDKAQELHYEIWSFLNSKALADLGMRKE